MIKLREIVNELNGIPKPTRRRAEVLVKLVYLSGREDEKKSQLYRINRNRKIKIL